MRMNLKQKENELNFLKKKCNCNISRERHCKIRVSFLLQNVEKVSQDVLRDKLQK